MFSLDSKVSACANGEQMNMGGAKDRPDLGQVWENSQALLEGRGKIHGSYKLQSFFKVMKGMMFGSSK